MCAIVAPATVVAVISCCSISQVLVRQASTSVNPVEGKVIRSGTAYGAKPPKVRAELSVAVYSLKADICCQTGEACAYVQVPGGDIAGVVDVADADSKVCTLLGA